MKMISQYEQYLQIFEISVEHLVYNIIVPMREIKVLTIKIVLVLFSELLHTLLLYIIYYGIYYQIIIKINQVTL